MKKRVISDPLYGFIEIEDEIILELINTKFFQRLRRISQLSAASTVYPTATHTRFTHCLGVYQLAFEVLKNPTINFSEREKLLFLTVSLLHDIGHGAFSHHFDYSFKTVHEFSGAYIIENDIEITTILDKIDKDFKYDVGNILRKEDKFKIIQTLLSSQLDIDRLDYLRRDAYLSSLDYGKVDVRKILTSLVIKDDKVCFLKSSVFAIESYLMNRYYMYMQLYLHPSSNAREYNLTYIYNYLLKEYEKTKDYIIDGVNFKELFDVVNNKESFDLQSYLMIDDSYIIERVKQLSLKTNSNYLKELCEDFLYRRGWKYILYNDKNMDEIKNIKKTATLYLEHTDQKTIYKEIDDTPIYIIDNDGEIKRLLEVSPILEKVVKIKTQKRTFLMYK